MSGGRTRRPRGPASTRRPRRRLAPALALAPAVVIALAACGVPTGGDSFERIENEDVPAGLAEPSSTTTTTPTTTTTVPAVPLTTIVATTTTTTMPPATFTVPIFWISRGELRPLEQSAPTPLSDSDLIELLHAGPPPELSSLLDTAVENGLINGSEEQRGIVTIDLSERVFDRIPRSLQTEAIGQIVLTFLQTLPRVGLALFTIEGEPTDVLTGDNRLTSDPVAFDDYANLLADSPQTAVSTTTTSTTAPAVPAEPADPPAPATTTTAAPAPTTTTTTAPATTAPPATS